MKLAALAPSQLRDALRHEGLTLRMSPFVARLRSDLDRVARDLQLLYGDFEVGDSSEFADCHLQVRRESGLRGWIKAEARFLSDGEPAFSTLPAQQAFHMVEWGLNWAVTSSAHEYLVYHAALLERDGQALMLPAPPGSGKSTLAAALCHRGWRLLSDELTLYDPISGWAHGLARPVNLKNQAIELIRKFAPGAVMTEPVADTAKGTLALMRAPDASLARRTEPARPRWVVRPSYDPGGQASLRSWPKAQMLLLLAEQAFNYDIHGRAGFLATADLVQACDCLDFSYSSLDDAVAVFEALASGQAAA